MAGQATEIQRRISIGSVNVEDGLFTVWDQKSIQYSDLAEAAVASASIPGVFPPHYWEGKGRFMDGGTVYNLNIDSAI